MAPIALKDFLIATAGASASFIGLLFVAISFVLTEKNQTAVARLRGRMLAESSYAALLNVFFISLVALVPNTNIGYAIAAMAITGFISICRMIQQSGGYKTHGSTTIAYLGSLYGLELVYGIFVLLQNNSYYINRYGLMTLFLFLFSTGLARAWEVTGIRK